MDEAASQTALAVPGPARKWLEKHEHGRLPAIVKLVVGQMFAILFLDCVMLVAWFIMAGPDWIYGISPEDVGLFFFSMPLLWIAVLLVLRQQTISRALPHYYAQFARYSPLDFNLGSDSPKQGENLSFARHLRQVMRELPRRIRQQGGRVAEDAAELSVVFFILALAVLTWLILLHLRMAMWFEMVVYGAVLMFMLLSYRRQLSRQVRELAVARHLLGLDVLWEAKAISGQGPGRGQGQAAGAELFGTADADEGTGHRTPELEENSLLELKSFLAHSKVSVRASMWINFLLAIVLTQLAMQWRLSISGFGNWMGEADRLDLAVLMLPLPLMWVVGTQWLRQAVMIRQLPALVDLFSRQGLLSGGIGEELLTQDSTKVFRLRIRLLCRELPGVLRLPGQPGIPLHRHILLVTAVLALLLTGWLAFVHYQHGVFMEFPALWAALLIMLAMFARGLQHAVMEMAVASYLLGSRPDGGEKDAAPLSE